MGPLTSITSRSNLQSGWLPVLTDLATGTGGTATCLVTVTEPVRQPSVHAIGTAGVVDGDAGWLVAGGAEVGWPELDGLALGGELVAHDARLTAATASAAQKETKVVVWRCMACSRYEIP